jgi:hypothetical protein
MKGLADIREKQDFAVLAGKSGIESRGLASLLEADDFDWDLIVAGGKAGGQFDSSVTGLIVEDDDFKTIAGVFEAKQGFQLGDDEISPVVNSHQNCNRGAKSQIFGDGARAKGQKAEQERVSNQKMKGDTSTAPKNNPRHK